MTNRIHSVGGAMPARKLDIADLEDPIENARRMASILSDMVEVMVGGNRCKWPDRHDLYHFTPDQRENLVFAAFHCEEMVGKIREMWEPINSDYFDRRAAERETSSLLQAIRDYQASLEDFNKNAPRDDAGANAYSSVSYGPKLDVLKNWSKPAETREAAIAALQIALTDDGGVYNSDAGDAMMKAALGYLEGAAA
ncbi:hypothetical protein [Rhizobium sp. Rhizsp82]|uniref:hypothetical protein n=1 Tax=Rhizobium sp. Rhizsp82 TaxID=3243057 RepID=UPI0039B46B82